MDELSEDAEMAARAARRRVRGLVRPFAERLMTKPNRCWPGLWLRWRPKPLLWRSTRMKRRNRS